MKDSLIIGFSLPCLWILINYLDWNSFGDINISSNLFPCVSDTLPTMVYCIHTKSWFLLPFILQSWKCLSKPELFLPIHGSEVQLLLVRLPVFFISTETFISRKKRVWDEIECFIFQCIKGSFFGEVACILFKERQKEERHDFFEKKRASSRVNHALVIVFSASFFFMHSKSVFDFAVFSIL